MRLFFAAMAAALLTTTGVASAADATPQALIDQMRSGGLVIFIRHATTESDYADQVTADPLDCSTQRTLSEAGWQEAVKLGEAFRYFDIPVGHVISSQYCRAWQTAWLAFGDYRRDPGLNFAAGETYTEPQLAAMRQGMTAAMGTEVPDGQNLVLVGHDDPFEAVSGIYPEPMGVTFVLRPDSQGGFEVLGSIAPDAWPGM